MTDWRQVPVFGQRAARRRVTIRPSAYGLIIDPHGRLAIVHAPSGVYPPGGGCQESEAPEDTVAREAREECGLRVRLGTWRRASIEHVFSPAERAHFEKRSVFCAGRAFGAAGERTDSDHALEWVNAAEAPARVTPVSHRWAINEWLADRTRDAAISIGSRGV